MEFAEAIALAERRFNARLPDFRRRVETDLAAIREHAGFTGVLSSTATRDELYRRCVDEIRLRVRTAWEDCLEVIESARIAIPPDFVAIVNQHVTDWTRSVLEESSLLHAGGNAFFVSFDLDTPFREAHKSVAVEIELFAARLYDDQASAALSNPPSVFISHIAEDAAIAGSLKLLLQAACGDQLLVFVASDYESIRSGAEWHGEILKAIKRSSVLVALLSEDSVSRPWINYEIGAADILDMLVVPTVIRGLGKSDLRPPLARRHARNLVNMNEVNALIADIAHRLQLDLVSPVGAGLADRVASEASKPSVARRLSEPARQVAKHLCERSVNAMELDPIVELSELIELLGVGVEELELVIDELRDLGWITTRTDASSPIGIASVSPTARMFIAMDPIVKGWNPLGDSRVLLGLLRKEGRRDGFRLAELAEESGWAPRRINVSAQLLDQEGFIRSDRTTGSGPFAFQTARLLARGRRV